MKDRWINAGFDEDELKPFVEPELDISDQKRIGTTPNTKKPRQLDPWPERLSVYRIRVVNREVELV